MVAGEVGSPKVVNLGQVFLSDGQGLAAWVVKPSQLGDLFSPLVHYAGVDAHQFRDDGKTEQIWTELHLTRQR